MSTSGENQKSEKDHSEGRTNVRQKIDKISSEVVDTNPYRLVIHFFVYKFYQFFSTHNEYFNF